MSSFSLEATPIPVLVLLVIAGIGFLFGMLKGTFRSLSDLVFVLLNAVLSTVIAKGIAKAILTPQKFYEILVSANEKINSEAISNLIAQIEPYLSDGEFLATADLSYVLALPAVIIAPIIFMVVFLVLGLIFNIVKLVVHKLLIPKTSNLGLKIIGGAIGAIKNVLAVAIFIVPIIGYANFAFDTVDSIGENIESQEVVLDVQEQASNVLDDGVIGAIDKFGGNWLFETLSTTEVHEVRLSLKEETIKIINIYDKIVPLTGIESANLTENEIKMLNEAIDEMEKSEYLTATIASILSQVSKELYEHKELVVIKLPDYGKTFNPLVETVLQVFSTADSEGIVKDLRTVSAIVETMVEKGLFRELTSEEGDLYLVLENGEFYSEIFVELYRNERTRPFVPAIANAMQSYLYDVYESVNGFQYGNGIPERMDESKINEVAVSEEGFRIAAAIKELRHFAQTVQGGEYVDEIVKMGDFSALGRGLNLVRDSIIFGNMYHFLLDAVLHSDTCANLGIFDSNFIESATAPDADMESLLLSRQSITLLTIAMWEGDKTAQEESLKVLIEQVMAHDTDALKELVEAENLEKYGVRGEKGETISSIVSTLADTIHTHEYVDENGDGSTEDEKHAEAEKTAHILTVITDAHNHTSDADNVFDNGDGLSKSGETAENLVDIILDSAIATEMIDSATQNSELDPYNVQNSLTASDTEALQNALANKYGSVTTEEEKAVVDDIANIFGITLVP
ncbi:MAG: CvpA family protein [Clostridia bacterium]|nr:CvpA family protein [Clostridia bacterium]